jgi:hypothetical protein
MHMQCIPGLLSPSPAHQSLRCIKAWDMQILCHKYGDIKLIVSEKVFDTCICSYVRSSFMNLGTLI